MGNQPSTANSGDDKPNNNTTELAEYINTIASELIRGQDFRDMKDLLDPKKCNDLVIITADIFEKYLTGKEVEYLDHRIKDGIVDTNSETALTVENVAFFKKRDLKNLDVDTRDSDRSLGTRKRRICIGIAKFYIKLAHVFAAIKTTINEEFIKDSSSGRERERHDDYQKGDYYDYYDKKYGGGYPDGRAKLSLCGRRLISLLNDRNSSRGTVLSPEICKSEYNNRIQKLDDELGIPELESLYNNLYEYDEAKSDWKKQFSGRDKKNNEEYKRDLKSLYNQITSDYTDETAQNKALPNEITRFSDVNVPSYDRTVRCDKNDKSSLRNEILYKVGDQFVENPLIIEYTRHIKEMEDEIQKKHKELTEILKEMFKSKKLDDSEKTEIVIDPELTFKKLQGIVEKTRKIIVSMYLDCDKNYKKGIRLFSQMVASKIVDRAEESTDKILKQRDEDLVETPRESSDYKDDRKERHREDDRERDRDDYGMRDAFEEPKKDDYKTNLFSSDDSSYEKEREQRGILDEEKRVKALQEIVGYDDYQRRKDKERRDKGRDDGYYGGKKTLKNNRVKNNRKNKNKNKNKKSITKKNKQ